MSTELDKDIAATMTPEELEAINAEASPEEQLIMRQQAEADADGEDDGDDDASDAEESKANDSDANGQETKVDDTKEAAATTSGDVQGDEQKLPVADEADGFKPKYVAQLPEGFADKLTALAEQENALWAKFEAGEIDRAEMRAPLRAIEAERSELSKLQVKAEISTEMTQQSAAQEWEWSVKRFVAQVAKNEKIDYTKDADKQADLDMFVKALANDARNNNKPNDWFLEEAHRLVKAKNGIAVTTTPAQQTVAEAKEARKPPVANVPKTLAQVPGGEGPGDLAGEFANLDTLSGMELENALAKMTPAQRERYSQGL
jgi:hypothetical protein